MPSVSTCHVVFVSIYFACCAFSSRRMYFQVARAAGRPSAPEPHRRCRGLNQYLVWCADACS